MDVWEKIWYYCPMPIRSRRKFFNRVVIGLRLPLPSSFRKLHFFRVVTSLILTVSLFYFGLLVSVVAANGTTMGIGVLSGNPFLVLLSIPAFILIWGVIDSLLSAAGGRSSKLLLLTVLLIIIIPAGLAQGINSGAFDVLTLTNDSYIDLHRCLAFVTVKNEGFKDLLITDIEVAEIMRASLDYSPRLLKRGQTYTYRIDYLYSDSRLAGTSVTPTTFRERKYPVVIRTEGILTYRFDVSASFPDHEQIEGIQAQTITVTEMTINNQNMIFPSINITFKAPPLALIKVYSISIGNLLLTLNPPSTVRGLMVYNGADFLYQLNLYFRDGQYIVDGIYESPTVNDNPRITSYFFVIGQTYDVTVRTMENNNYSAAITMGQ